MRSRRGISAAVFCCANLGQAPCRSGSSPVQIWVKPRADLGQVPCKFGSSPVQIWVKPRKRANKKQKRRTSTVLRFCKCGKFMIQLV